MIISFKVMTLIIFKLTCYSFWAKSSLQVSVRQLKSKESLTKRNEDVLGMKKILKLQEGDTIGISKRRIITIIIHDITCETKKEKGILEVKL